MANDFYTASGSPATGSQGSSATMRAEFTSIEDGFDKLPVMTGNGGEIVAVNSGGTALEALTTTGTGSAVKATSPTLVTPVLGVATATSINGTTIPSSKTLVVTTDKLSVMAATSSSELASVISDETGSGALVFANTPTLVTPVLGTPTSGTLSNCTGLPVSTGVSGFGTNVATALAVNVGSSGAFVTNGGALGTPSSGTLTNATGLPVSTGISGLGSGVADFLATPSSANLASAVTDETGSGALVFATSPTLTTPNIGVATATSVNGTTIPSSKTLVVTTDKLSALAATTSAELAGVISDETGSGALVFGTSPTIGTATINTPTISGGTINNAIIGGSTPAAGTFTDLLDSAGNVRDIPQNAKTSGYTLEITDAGKHISITTGGVTVPASVFSAGDVVSIYNNSGSNQTITQGASTTVRLAGTATTGNRTLAQYGICTVLCVASNVFVISGAGLS